MQNCILCTNIIDTCNRSNMDVKVRDAEVRVVRGVACGRQEQGHGGCALGRPRPIVQPSHNGVAPSAQSST